MTTLRAAALLTMLSVSAHSAMAESEPTTSLASEDGQYAVTPVTETDDVVSAVYAHVRLTWYAEAGVTYSGVWTYPGSTACSWNFPIGSRFRFPDGEVFTCIDRGHLSSIGWLDLYRRKDLADKYGPWATVEVIP